MNDWEDMKDIKDMEDWEDMEDRDDMEDWEDRQERTGMENIEGYLCCRRRGRQNSPRPGACPR